MTDAIATATAVVPPAAAEPPKETKPETTTETKGDAKAEVKEYTGPLDMKVEFKGWGVTEPGLNFVPVSYHPRKLGPNDVEIRITHASICGSDLHTASGGWGPLVGTPCIVGHEIVGEVVAKGPKAKLKIGERVGVGAQVLSCQEKGCGHCGSKKDNLCQKKVFTYNSLYADGSQAQGGYAEAIRVHEWYAFPIPKDLPSDVAVPLLCAGTTLYTPLTRFKVNKKMKVGVIGFGGLGMMGLLFGSKMGAQMFAIGHSKSKEEDAKKCGAHKYIDVNNEEDMKSITGQLDVVLCTANAKGMNWQKYLALVKQEGTFCLLGVPEENISFHPIDVIMRQITITGSLIGSKSDVVDMLKFASKNKIRPIVEHFPMEKVNEAVQKVQNSTIRYRAVLLNEKKEEKKDEKKEAKKDEKKDEKAAEKPAEKADEKKADEKKADEKKDDVKKEEEKPADPPVEAK